MSDPVRDFLLDANGHLAVVNGDFATVSGQLAVKQGIGVHLKMFLGDCFLDESQGIDYFGQVLIKDADPAIVSSILANAILDVTDVTQVSASDLELTPQRDSSVHYEVVDVYSTSTQPNSGTVLVKTP